MHGRAGWYTMRVSTWLLMPLAALPAPPASAHLVPLAFEPLPVGAVRPAGWLRAQLLLQADGLSGHMALFWHDIVSSVWLNGTFSEGDGLNEDLPYWANGFVPLVFLLKEERPALMSQLHSTIDRIVAAQSPDGWFGPHDRPVGDGGRYWRQYPLLLALTQYAEGADPTRGATIVASIRRFLHGLDGWLQHTPCQSWSHWRWQDMAMTVFWMLDHQPAGEETFLIGLARTLAEQGFDWGKNWFNDNFQNCTSRSEAGITNCPPPPPPCAGCSLPGPATTFSWGAQRLQTFDPAAWHPLPNGSLAFELREHGQPKNYGEAMLHDGMPAIFGNISATLIFPAAGTAEACAGFLVRRSPCSTDKNAPRPTDKNAPRDHLPPGRCGWRLLRSGLERVSGLGGCALSSG
jgi:hypothetical protein